ncbi:MAG: helix-hairpin-helix domain-containing protein [Bdellovibrionaceae bacterium]|nr:helix-hairpin-helix domain-containing protein [Pseudobdellovibrionaceae bacterium]
MKAKQATDAKMLEQIPNVGPAVAKDLNLLGITKPQQLIGKDGLALYKKLNKLSGVRHDPCAADVLMAAVDFMNGGKPKPWWKFTEKRKQLLKKEI